MLQVFNIPEGAAAAAREPPAGARRRTPGGYACLLIARTIDRIMSATMTISPAVISIVPIFQPTIPALLIPPLKIIREDQADDVGRCR